MKKNDMPSIYLEIKKIKRQVLGLVEASLASLKLIGVADVAYYRVAGEMCLGLTYTSHKNCNEVLPGLKKFCKLAQLRMAVIPYPWQRNYTIIFIKKGRTNWRPSILNKISREDILAADPNDIQDIDF